MSTLSPKTTANVIGYAVILDMTRIACRSDGSPAFYRREGDAIRRLNTRYASHKTATVCRITLTSCEVVAVPDAKYAEESSKKRELNNLKRTKRNIEREIIWYSSKANIHADKIKMLSDQLEETKTKIASFSK